MPKVFGAVPDRALLSREEMIAVGDQLNDLPMIAYAGLGVAMGNAVDAVKAAAGYVTDDNDHEGVAKVIGKFIWF